MSTTILYKGTSENYPSEALLKKFFSKNCTFNGIGGVFSIVEDTKGNFLTFESKSLDQFQKVCSQVQECIDNDFSGHLLIFGIKSGTINELENDYTFSTTNSSGHWNIILGTGPLSFVKGNSFIPSRNFVSFLKETLSDNCDFKHSFFEKFIKNIFENFPLEKNIYFIIGNTSGKIKVSHNLILNEEYGIYISDEGIFQEPLDYQEKQYIIWFKVNLDIGKLKKTPKELYAEYSKFSDTDLIKIKKELSIPSFL
jgi:hypothetical protein